MGTKMTHAARVELTNEVRKRYCAAAGAEKSKILDEFIAVTGYHHKSAIRALNTEPIIKKRQTRARPTLYDEAVQAALIVLRYPGFYKTSHLRTLRRRVQIWRRQAIQRLISKMQDHTQDVGSGPPA
jgi:hypothetical protein